MWKNYKSDSVSLNETLLLAAQKRREEVEEKQAKCTQPLKRKISEEQIEISFSDDDPLKTATVSSSYKLNALVRRAKRESEDFDNYLEQMLQTQNTNTTELPNLSSLRPSYTQLSFMSPSCTSVVKCKTGYSETMCRTQNCDMECTLNNENTVYKTSLYETPQNKGTRSSDDTRKISPSEHCLSAKSPRLSLPEESASEISISELFNTSSDLDNSITEFKHNLDSSKTENVMYELKLKMLLDT